MGWIDDWLEGMVHRSVRQSLADRIRHERFVVARTVSVLGSLAALPVYLIARGVPSLVEFLTVLALSAPLAAVLLTARSGRLEIGQALVSLALAALAIVLVLARGDFFSALLLLILVIPVDGLCSGSRRAALAAALISVMGIIAVFVAATIDLAPARWDVATLALVAAASLAIGHAVALVTQDWRLSTLMASAASRREARDSSILETIDDLVTWHDRNGSVLKANAAAARLLGIPAATLHGRGLLARILVPDRPLFLKAVSDAASATEPVVARFRLQPGDGPEIPVAPIGIVTRIAARAPHPPIWVEMRAHRLNGGAAEEARVVAVTRSIADHVSQAEEYARFKQSAEQAGASRAKLLALAWQELRLPAQAIAGFADLLRAREPTVRGDDGPAYVEAIRSSSRALLDILANLNDLSRIGTGAYPLAPGTLDVLDLCEEVRDLFQQAAEQDGERLFLDLSPGLPAIHADREACRTMLGILVRIVSQALPAGTPLALSARREGDRLSLAVAADGTALDMRSLPAPLLRHTDGGLVFQVACGLAELHRGRIHLAVGPQGLAATLTLPLEPQRVNRPSPIQGSPSNAATCGMLALKTD